MKKFENTMKELHADMHLSRDEKDRMRERLHAYMQHVPRRVPQRGSTAYTSVLWFVRYHRIGAVFAIVALLFGSGVGVSYAASDALPGEALYAVKELKEELALRLIVDDVAQTEYAIERTQNRLREIEALAAKGKLDANTEALATEKFAISVQRAQESIAQLEERDAAEAEALHIAFVVGLRARVDTLATPTSVATGIENDARTRIAHIAQAQLAARFEQTVPTMALMAYSTETSTEDADISSDTRSMKNTMTIEAVATDAATEVIASTPAPEVGMMAMVQEDEGGGAGAARTTTLIAEQPKTAPATVTALMRTLVKEREKLTTVQKALPEGSVRAKLEIILKNVADIQTDISVALSAGDYARAEMLIQEALRTIYKTHASLDASLEIDTSATTIPFAPTESIETLPQDVPNVVEEEIVPLPKEHSLF